jgi:hypothetical protein
MDSMQWFREEEIGSALTEIVDDRGVPDRIGAEHSNKFVDGSGQESLHREKQAD